MAIETINPANNQLVKSFDEYSSEQVSLIIEKAQTAFLTWREISFMEISKLMFNAAKVLRNNKNILSVFCKFYQ